MEQSYVQQVNAILGESNLSEEDRDLWRKILNTTDAALARIFVAFFEEKRDDLGQITELLKRKIAAREDRVLAEAVLEEERRELMEALNDE